MGKGGINLEAAAYNKAYLASLRFAQIPRRGTSNMPKKLSEIRSAISNGRLTEA